ncbi:MAG: ribonuclease HI, partial [Bdellovibrio sp. CG_4_9_14_3_um_filter_39_7]
QTGKLEVHVYTDSRYIVDGMNQWLQGWKQRGWRKADNKVPENLEYWKRLDEITSFYWSVGFHWVRGHSGHPQNEHCDRLCNQAIDEARL